jgi:short-subunit dehydrogenase
MTKPAPRAMITGASAGIGLTYAEHLARTGHDLVIVARRGDLLERHAKHFEEKHNVDVEVIVADLATADGLARVASRFETDERIDLFINNAGYAARGKVDALDPSAMATMLQLNVVAMSHLSHSAMRRMTADGAGRIINIASATCFILIPGNAAYGASKNYVMAFTRHMQLEAEGTAVKVQLLVPGVIETDFHALAGGDLAAFPPAMIMTPDDLVVASLRALEMDEAVCIPSLPDIKDWAAYLAAEKVVAANVSRDHPAARYH